MQQFNQTILDVVGNTPIIKLNASTTNVASEIYAKLEFLNDNLHIQFVHLLREDYHNFVEQKLDMRLLD